MLPESGWYSYLLFGAAGWGIMPSEGGGGGRWLSWSGQFLMRGSNFLAFPPKIEVPATPLLTAILETDQITDSLMSLSETSFQKYFNQLDWACEFSRDDDMALLEDSAFLKNIVTVLHFQSLGQPESGKRAIRNPLYAGTIFSYLAFFCNLEVGCAVVDSRAQLRMVLFLYHGLLLNGIIEKGQIHILDIVYNMFKNCRTVWEGPLPRRGELVQRFWICFGVNILDSKLLATLAQERFDSSISTNRRLDKAEPSSFGRPRKMKPIILEEISKSYRRVCNHDFDDVVDNYHTPEQRDRAKHTEYYMLAVRGNDMLDAIDEEQPLLSLHLIACSIFLEQFVCSLT